jgi:hypothetical protein
VSALRRRDARAAESVIAELEKDPDTAALVPVLESDFDPLRTLPLPSLGSFDESSLRRLRDVDLAWLHRLIWAEAGFHFSDPAVADYFALWGSYRPMREKEWRKLAADPFFQKDYDRSILVRYDPSFRILKKVEKERGLSPPPL